MKIYFMFKKFILTWSHSVVNCAESFQFHLQFYSGWRQKTSTQNSAFFHSTADEILTWFIDSFGVKNVFSFSCCCCLLVCTFCFTFFYSASSSITSSWMIFELFCVIHYYQKKSSMVSSSHVWGLKFEFIMQSERFQQRKHLKFFHTWMF